MGEKGGSVVISVRNKPKLDSNRFTLMFRNSNNVLK